MHVPKSLWTKPVGGNLETSREWSAKPHCCSGTKRRGSASGWTSVQSEHTWEARTKPSIVLELCLPASHAFCSHSLLSPKCHSILGYSGRPFVVISWTVPRTLSFLPMFLLVTPLLEDEISVLKMLFLTLAERGITSTVLARGTVQCKTCTPGQQWGGLTERKKGSKWFHSRYPATLPLM